MLQLHSIQSAAKDLAGLNISDIAELFATDFSDTGISETVLSALIADAQRISKGLQPDFIRLIGADQCRADLEGLTLIDMTNSTINGWEQEE